jgi:taurine dioxygenase
MAYRITPLTEHTGAEIRGLDLTQPIDAATRAALNRAFAQHHVLVVRDQQYEPADFLRAVQLWGELQPHDKKEMHVPGFPQMYYVSNEEFLGGKRLIPGETFHTDHSNHPAPPKATILYPVALPSAGGDTQYVNMHLAYDDLPPATKRHIDGLQAVHVYLSKYSPRALKPLNEESLKALPPPGIHPLVRVHPENGRKALFLNPVRIESIVGMPDDAALDLVAELMAHATQRKYEYRHQWRYGDMVMWDNRSVMHKANPDYDMNQRRFLYRLMLKGEPPIPVAAAA